MKKVIAVVGPTAVGKTSLGIKMANDYNGEIISGDSIQVYKELNIGSAKINQIEKEAALHHLIDIKDINENYNVAEFQRNARNLIDEISLNHKLPIIVGGTGLYVKAVLYDYVFKDEIETSEPKLEQYSNEQLMNELLKLDPLTADKIHINNRKRLLRALTMALKGTSRSEVLALQEHQLIYDCLIIGLSIERSELYKRIDQRVDDMIQTGLFDEVDNLYHKYPDLFTYQAMQGIGYREWQAYYSGLLSKDEVIQEIKKHSRQFAKRQYTWFNNQMNVDWYDINEADFIDKIMKKVARWLRDE